MSVPIRELCNKHICNLSDLNKERVKRMEIMVLSGKKKHFYS